MSRLQLHKKTYIFRHYSFGFSYLCTAKFIVMKRICLIILCALSLVACKPEVEIEKPTVVTKEIVSITDSSAVVVCSVINDGGSEVTSRGICWSTSSNPTIDNADVLTSGSGTGDYEINILNLEAETNYYVKAYAVNSEGISYGEEKNFTTLVKEDVFADKTITVNGVSFTMKAVEGGTFFMGAQNTDPNAPNYDAEAWDREYPVHSVTLSDYYIGETEVTQELWQAVMGYNPSHFVDDNNPVEQVSWYTCQTFVTQLNEMTGMNFRLLTEAEWEYAARGGNKSEGYIYSGSDSLEDVAWFADNSAGKTHEVKTKIPNELGIYDMCGNVLEWCQDIFGDYSSEPQTDPEGALSGSDCVIRGSGCRSSVSYCRLPVRCYLMPGGASYSIGFRLAMECQ